MNANKTTRNDHRFLDASDPNAVLIAYWGDDGCGEMGAWADDNEDDYMAAIVDELRYALADEDVEKAIATVKISPA